MSQGMTPVGVPELDEWLDGCELCPHRCGARRLDGETGPCAAGAVARLASATIHRGEEPPISGTGGSAAFFFSHCPLACRFCQNYPISQLGHGRDISVDEISEKMLRLAARGAHNINVVTGTQFVPHIVAAVARARDAGLTVPVVWNTSGYETEETIDKLTGTVDIYLTDIKYTNDEVARSISAAADYFRISVSAAKRMLDQVGPLRVDEQGIGVKGVIIRHLVLPNNLSDTSGVMGTIVKRFGLQVPVSVMGQYFPAHRAIGAPGLDRALTREEYEAAKEAVRTAGIEEGWFQEMDDPSRRRGA